jgi:tetratricopeptide (TPR) repeat protein
MLLRTLAKLELWNGNLVEGWKWARKAYDLEPNNPEEIAALARTWLILGDPERADGLIREGLKTSGQNANLLNARWMTLVVARRYEEAEALVKETKKQSGADLPPTLERHFNFQLGMIALIQEQYPRAHRLLLAAVNEEDQLAYSGDDVWVLTLAALAAERVGEAEQAAELLDNAERRMRRGRLNGVDDPGIVYNEAVLLAMRDEPARALFKLQEAYDKGFREAWALEIDGRLGPLRDSPEFIALKHRIQDDLAAARLEIESLLLAVL